MTNELDDAVISGITAMYDFFGRLGIINYEVYSGEVVRRFHIRGTSRRRWIGIDITTCDGNREVVTRFSLRKDCRYLSIEGNIKEDIYRVHIPRHPLEEDKEARDLMRRIFLSLKAYELQRDTPLVLDYIYHV